MAPVPTPSGQDLSPTHPPTHVFQLLSAEILQHRGLVERLLGISDPLLRACPEPLRQHLQVSHTPGCWDGCHHDGCPQLPQ